MASRCADDGEILFKQMKTLCRQ